MTTPLRHRPQGPLHRTASIAAVAVAALASVALSGCSRGEAAAAPSGVDAITVVDATIDWPANPRVAAVRMLVENGAAEGDVLLAVASPVAQRTEIHRSDIDADGQVSMTEQPSVDVPARSTVTFEPSGLHVMLTGITDELQVGDEVALVLTFERAGEVRATATVVEPGTADGPPGDDPGSDHDDH